MNEELIRDIYTAALHPRHWPPILAQIGKIWGGQPASFEIHLTKSARVQKQTTCLNRVYVPPVPNSVFSAGPYPTAYELPSLLGNKLGRMSLIKQTAFYNTFLTPPQWLYGLNLRLVKHPAYSIVLAIKRLPGQGSYTPEEISHLRCLAPHLRQALQIVLRLASTETQRGGLEGLLDSLTIATVLLNASGQIIYTNATAKKILACNDGLEIRNGELVATHRSSQTILSQAVTAAQTLNSEAYASITIVLRRPSNRQPYVGLVIPCPQASALTHGVDPQPAVMLFFSNPEAAVSPSNAGEVLQLLYGLTPKEARLAALLTNGCTLQEAAKALHVSFDTVKTQLKGIFAKANIHRQAELVRLGVIHNVPVRLLRQDERQRWLSSSALPPWLNNNKKPLF